MTEIIVESLNETVINIDGGPTLSTTVEESNIVVTEVTPDPILIDLNSGPQGEPGAAILTGVHPPDGTIGVMGDIYIVTQGTVLVGQVFRKTGPSTWTDDGNVRGPAGGVNSVAGKTGPDVILVKADVGLANVDDTSDAAKPISTATQAVLDTTVKLTGAQTITGLKTFDTRVDFTTTGVAGPSTTTRSAGTKIVLFPDLNATQADYAIGIEGNHVWYSAGPSAGGHKWYSAATNTMTLGGAGNLSVIGTITGNNFVAPAGLTNSSARPAITNARIAGEIYGIGTSLAADDGFVRLSAGGGTSSTSKTYIDISGYSTVSDMNNVIVFGAGGAERARMNNSTFTLNIPLTTSQGITASSFTGNGASLTAINGTNISTGTVADARLSTNVATLAGTQTFSGSKAFSSEIIGPTIGNVLKVGDDARLVDVNAAHVMGVISQSDVAQGGVRLGSTATIAANGGALTVTATTANFTGTISGNGSGLTALNGTNISSGTVADARLSTNVNLLNASQTVSAVKTFSVSPIVPTPTTGTQAAHKQYVDDKVAALVTGAPALLDTLDELAAALGDDPNFATTITNNLAGKVALNATQQITGRTTLRFDLATAGSASSSLQLINDAVGGRPSIYFHQPGEFDGMLVQYSGYIASRNAADTAWMDFRAGAVYDNGNRVYSSQNLPPGSAPADSSVASMRANHVMTGGGTISVSSSAEVKWSQRLIVISNGNGSHFSTSGFFDITMPAAATVITGVGGAANATVNANGIPIGAWHSLYYVLPIGSTSATVNANFRVVGYTGGLVIPDNWVLVVSKNEESTQFRFGNGISLASGGSWTAAGGIVHNHDERYFTETELTNGALDGRYFTETEVNTSLAGKANSSHTHAMGDLPAAAAALAAYPVGAIYTSTVNTSPATLFGGTWAVFGTGQVLVGVDTAQTEFNTVMKTGGAKVVALSAAQSGLPAHTHTQNQHAHGQNSHNHGGATGDGLTTFIRVVAAAGPIGYSNHATGHSSSSYTDVSGIDFPGSAHYHNINSEAPGIHNAVATNQNNVAQSSAESHNNLQPFITVHMWRRTA